LSTKTLENFASAETAAYNKNPLARFERGGLVDLWARFDRHGGGTMVTPDGDQHECERVAGIKKNELRW